MMVFMQCASQPRDGGLAVARGPQGWVLYTRGVNLLERRCMQPMVTLVGLCGYAGMMVIVLVKLWASPIVTWLHFAAALAHHETLGNWL